MSFMETYRRWLEETEDNEEIHGELVSVQEDPAAIDCGACWGPAATA